MTVFILYRGTKNDIRKYRNIVETHEMEIEGETMFDVTFENVVKIEAFNNWAEIYFNDTSCAMLENIEHISCREEK